MSFQDYIENSRTAGIQPKNPYDHSFAMLQRDEDDLTQARKLLQRQILLGNIKDDYLIRIYQNDNMLIGAFYELQQRNPIFHKVFEEIFNTWVREIRMTGIKGGKERFFQSMLGGKYEPKEELEGYGYGDVARDGQTNLREMNQGKFGLTR